tara:strand:+ start:224 stop:553 length:330 start_codon:yes stop_codon:yes gene_type:complete
MRTQTRKQKKAIINEKQSLAKLARNAAKAEAIEKIAAMKALGLVNVNVYLNSALLPEIPTASITLTSTHAPAFLEIGVQDVHGKGKVAWSGQNDGRKIIFENCEVLSMN